MVKYYCDRCGAESEKLVSVRIPTNKVSELALKAEVMGLCPQCEKQANDIYNLCSDIKIMMFERFTRKEQSGCDTSTRSY